MVYITTGVLEKDRAISLDSILQELIEHNNGRHVGGIGLFIGIVKGVVDEKHVLELEYEVIKELADKKLHEIASQVAEKYGINGIIILHRVGVLKPGEITLTIAVSGDTRKKILPALTEALERVKHEVPVFKLERRLDGEYWIIGDSTRIPKK